MNDFYSTISEQSPEVRAAVEAAAARNNVALGIEAVGTVVSALISATIPGGKILECLQVSNVTKAHKFGEDVSINIVTGTGNEVSTLPITKETTVEAAAEVLIIAIGTAIAENAIAGLGLSVGANVFLFAAAGMAISALVSEGYNGYMDNKAIVEAAEDGSYAISCRSSLDEFLEERWERVKDFSSWSLRQDGDPKNLELSFLKDENATRKYTLRSNEDIYLSKTNPKIFLEICKNIKTDFNYQCNGQPLDVIHNYVEYSYDDLMDIRDTDSGFFAMKYLAPFSSENFGSGGFDLSKFSDQYKKDRASFLYYSINPGETVFDQNEKILFYDNYLEKKKEGENKRPGFNENYYTAASGYNNLLDSKIRYYTFGSGEDETINGEWYSDHLYGEGGKDTINGYDGDDYIEGGIGNDTLKGGDDNDTIYGGDDNDSIEGEDGNDIIYGGDSNDNIIGGAGQDSLYGGDGNDIFTILGEDASYDVVFGGAGYDQIEGGGTEDTFRFNMLLPGNSIETINGLGGQNKIEGTDSLIDILDFSDTNLYYIDEIRGLGQGDKIVGSQFSDKIFGDGGGDTLVGGLAGEGEWDFLDGGEGFDHYIVQAGGQVTISDSDRQGMVYTDDGTFLSGAFLKQHDGSYVWFADSETKAVYLGSDFTIDHDDRMITLKDLPNNLSNVTLVDPNKTGITLTGTNESDCLIAREGNNLTVPDTTVVANGDAGNDMICGGKGDDVLNGGIGDDRICGFGGDDVISGGEGSDYITGLSGKSMVQAGEGDDLVVAKFQNYFYIKGDFGSVPEEKVWIDFSRSMVHELPGSDKIAFDSNSHDLTFTWYYANRELSKTGPNGDYMEWSGDSSYGNGWTYKFVISPESGDMSIPNQQWTIKTTYTHSILAPEGRTSSSGFKIGWMFKPYDDPNSELSIDGGSGNDAIVGNLGGDNIAGGIGNDTLFGDKGNDTLLGGGDRDLLSGGEGDDRISGGDGEDSLFGGEGDDILEGGAHNDTLIGDSPFKNPPYVEGQDVLRGGQGNDLIDGRGGNDTLEGGTGQDTLLGGDGQDKLFGDDGRDSLLGSDGDDELVGGTGNDTLSGEGDNDLLQGGEGDDVLVGGRGDDTLNGGAGMDFLEGGSGDDTYVFEMSDSPLNGIVETIHDLSGYDQIKFGQGLSAQDLKLYLVRDNPSDLVLTYQDGNAIYITNGVNLAVEKIVFEGGDVVMMQDLIDTRWPNGIPKPSPPSGTGGGGTGDDPVFGPSTGDIMGSDFFVPEMHESPLQWDLISGMPLDVWMQYHGNGTGGDVWGETLPPIADNNSPGEIVDPSQYNNPDNPGTIAPDGPLNQLGTRTNPIITGPANFSPPRRPDQPTSTDEEKDKASNSAAEKANEGSKRSGSRIVRDPLVLDLDGDGVELVNLDDVNVHFDLEGDGFATRTSWLSPDDGFVAWDRNNDGTINDIKELFGSPTRTGFDELSDLDSNGDGVIDAQDADFSSLQIWRDLNSNGISEQGELQSLSFHGIEGIQLATTAFTGENGGDGTIEETGHFLRSDGSTGEASDSMGMAADVLFSVEPHKSEFVGSVEVPDQIKALPDIKGFGKMPDLQEAMSLDGRLRQMVVHSRTLLSSRQAVAIFNSILYSWAGVSDITLQDIDPQATLSVNAETGLVHFPLSGAAFSVQQLGVLQAYTGIDVLKVQEGEWQNASGGTDTTGNLYFQAWNSLYRNLLSKFLVATGCFESEFPGLTYNPETDQLSIDYDLTSQGQDFSEYLENFWVEGKQDPTAANYALLLGAVLSEISPSFGSTVRELLGKHLSDSVLFTLPEVLLNALNVQINNPYSPTLTAIWEEGSVLIGSGFDETLQGSIGNDYLIGGGGDDILYGGNGDDTFHFGFGDGKDRLYPGGTDEIEVLALGEGVSTSDLTLERIGDDLLLHVGAQGDQVRIVSFFNTSTTTQLDQIRFFDGTSMTPEELIAQSEVIVAGSANNDVLDGTVGKDQIRGEGGNDNLTGHGGDDLIRGDAGNDFLFGNAGADTLEGGEGDDGLYGGDGNDSLTGGSGKDEFFGGTGDDVFYFNPGHGDDTLHLDDSTGLETVVFGEGIEVSDLLFRKDGNSLIAYTQTYSDLIRFKDWFVKGDEYKIDQFKFADGSVLTRNELLAEVTTWIPGWSGEDVLYGTEGKDLIKGEGGNDNLTGHGGDDLIQGDAGNDFLFGNAGADTLEGGEGDDGLYGGDDNDSLTGGTGKDSLWGGAGDDTFHFEQGHGDDTLYLESSTGHETMAFGPGIALSDLLLRKDGDNLIIYTGGSGNLIRIQGWYSMSDNYKLDQFTFDDGTSLTRDQLLTQLPYWTPPGSEGNDNIVGSIGADLIRGHGGNDALHGGEGNDILEGGTGNDLLFGEDGNDVLIGGPGNDQLYGGAGDDTFHFNVGDGDDQLILDWSTGHETIVFGPGISQSDLLLRKDGDNLIIYTGGAGDLIRILGWYTMPDNYKLDQFTFDDGTSLTRDELLAQTLFWTPPGGAGNDYIAGSSSRDLLRGNDGNDELHGGDGDDILEGGAGSDSLFGENGNDEINSGQGNDHLYGGTGDNTFLFNVGDGSDTVNLGSTGFEVVEFGAGVDFTNLSYQRSGDDLIVSYGGAGDEITIKSWYNTSDASWLIDEFRFSDGQKFDRSQFFAGCDNSAPQISGPAELGQLAEDTTLFITAADLLVSATDPDGNTLTVENLSSDSGTLIDNGDGTWTFSPDVNENGSVEFTYEVSDGFASVATSANLSVSPQNDAPEVAGAVALGSMVEDGSRQITSAELLAQASDIDGDTLSISGLTSDSGTLVDNGDGTWGFTPDADDNGPVSFSYQVGDGTVTVAATADLNVTPANDAPEVAGAVALGSMVEDGSRLIMEAELLGQASDVDGDTLSISGLTSDSGTLVDNGNGTWRFAPDADYNGPVSFSYQVGDGTVTVAATASLDVTAVNDAPVVAGSVALGSMVEDGSRQITSAELLAQATDVDGDALSISGLTSDSGTLVDNGDGTWGFTPDADDNGPVSFSYQVGDGTVTVAATASLDVTAVNDAPVVAGSVALGSMVEDGSRQITSAELLAQASDIDGDSLSISGLTSDSGTLIDNGDGTWGFTPDTDDNGPVSFSYQVGDGTVTVAATADLNVTPANDAPVVAGAVALGSMVEDGSLQITSAELLAQASDIDGDTLSISGLTSDSGALVDNGDGTWGFTPDADYNGPVSFSYQVGDGTVTVGGTAALTVEPASNPLNPVNGTAGDDSLYGSSGADLLQAGAGNDYLSADDGDDVLIGGTGNDDLIGGGGDDTYRLNLGDGVDTIYNDDLAGIDTLAFGPGITLADLQLEAKDSDLVITYGSGGDQVTIDGWYFSSAFNLDRFTFENGEVLTSTELIAQSVVEQNGTAGDDSLWGDFGADIIRGDAGNDTLVGLDGDDTLIGGTGNDDLTGGSGNDTYQLNLGDGSDRIFNDDATGIDTLAFGPGITPADLQLEANDNDLVITYSAGGDKVTIDSWYFSSAFKLDRFTFENGEVLTGTELIAQSAVEQNGTAGDDSLWGDFGADIIRGDAGNDTLVGLDGDDTLIGGSGNDDLTGGAGNDTYQFGLGDGQDTIDNYHQEGSDRILFEATVTQADIGLFGNGDHLEIGYSDTDKVQISNYSIHPDYRVDQIVLDDGSTMTSADINSIIDQMAAYASANGISLSSVNDVRNNEDLMAIIATGWTPAV